MAIYECLFFSAGKVEYWENIDSDSDVAIKLVLRSCLLTGEWDLAEAWNHDRLVWRVEAAELGGRGGIADSGRA